MPLQTPTFNLLLTKITNMVTIDIHQMRQPLLPFRVAAYSIKQQKYTDVVASN